MRAGYAVCSALSRLYFTVAYGLSVSGLEHVPRSGSVILASNHRSNFDPPILGGVVPREVSFLAKEELFRAKILGGLITYLNAFPVRRGQFDRQALKACLGVLERGGLLLMFPEGTRAPVDGFLKAKVGVGWVVELTRAPVVPVYIHGSVIDKIRLRQRPAIRVVFGAPISADRLRTANLSGRELYQHISDRTLDAIRELSLQTPGAVVTSLGPVYSREIIDEERLR